MNNFFSKLRPGDDVLLRCGGTLLNFKSQSYIAEQWGVASYTLVFSEGEFNYREDGTFIHGHSKSSPFDIVEILSPKKRFINATVSLCETKYSTPLYQIEFGMTDRISTLTFI
jgi:hypothetical protein